MAKVQNKSNKELSPSDIRVAQRYIETGNGVQSVLDIYPDKKYTTAERYFERLLGNVGFQELIEESKQKAEDNLDITVEDLMLKLKTWYESDVTQALGLSIEEIKNLPEEIRQMVTGFKHSKTEFKGVETEVIELKFMNKEKIGDMIAKHKGFFEKHNTQKNLLVGKKSFDAE